MSVKVLLPGNNDFYTRALRKVQVNEDVVYSVSFTTRNDQKIPNKHP